MSGLAESAIQAALVDRLAKPDLGWRFVSPNDLPRQLDGVMLDHHVIEALVRLNPVIAERPDRVDEVLPRLRATLLAVANDGLVAANEEMTAWVCGRKTIRFLDTDDYVPVRLIDLGAALQE